MTPKQELFDFLEREHIGSIHLLLFCQFKLWRFPLFTVPNEFYQETPGLREVVESARQTIEQIMRLPSQKDFRKGRLPGEEKPLSKEKQLAAFLLATKERRESLRAVACLWNYLLLATQQNLTKKQINPLLVGFLLTRRSKLLRKWRGENRFRKLIQGFECVYTESLLNKIVAIVFQDSRRPLQGIIRELNVIRSIISRLDKSATIVFNDRLVKRFVAIRRNDRAAGEALALAVLFGRQPPNEKKFKAWFDSVVSESFVAQRNAIRTLATEPNKKKRIAVGASIEALMRMRQIVLMISLRMAGQAEYGKKIDRLIEKYKEKLRKSGRKKARKTK